MTCSADTQGSRPDQSGSGLVGRCQRQDVNACPPVVTDANYDPDKSSYIIFIYLWRRLGTARGWRRVCPPSWSRTVSVCMTVLDGRLLTPGHLSPSAAHKIHYRKDAEGSLCFSQRWIKTVSKHQESLWLRKVSEVKIKDGAGFLLHSPSGVLPGSRVLSAATGGRTCMRAIDVLMF